MTDNFKLALTFVNKLSEGKKNFDGINLSGAVLEGLTAYKGSSLNRATFRGCRLKAAVISGCLLKAANFERAELTDAVIMGSDCQRAIFQGANASRVNFSKSRLLHANLSQADLKGANFRQADLRGADFRGAILAHVEFRGAFYDDNTAFDAGINPIALGMRKVSQENSVKSQPDSAPRSDSKRQRSKKLSKGLTYRGARIDSSDNIESSVQVIASKDVMYRGVRMNRSDDSLETAQPAQPQSQNTHKKSRLTYRGVEI